MNFFDKITEYIFHFPYQIENYILTIFYYNRISALILLTCCPPGGMRYAETWDYQVTSSTFLQFDLAMGCSGTFSTLYHVMLEFSVNMGESWRPVLSACLPPARDCAGYHDSSSYLSQSHANWTRVSLYLPRAAVYV